MYQNLKKNNILNWLIYSIVNVVLLNICISPGGADLSLPEQDQGHQRKARHFRTEADRVRHHARHRGAAQGPNGGPGSCAGAAGNG